MNIEGITLLNQFIEYSCTPLTLIIPIVITVIIFVIGILMLKKNNNIGNLILCFAFICLGIICITATQENNKTFLNYPAYTHYIVQIDDKAAWSEIAPNYTIIKEVYPNTNIYEIKQKYKEGDEQ